jgi:zona occludens toxin (predicted ATPase)
MIYLIEGVPGSGKTTYVMQKYFLPAFKKGKRIYTNISGLNLVNMCALYEIDHDNIDNVTFVDPAKQYECQRMLSMNSDHNSLLILDETQNYFNSRDFKEQANRDVIPFLTEHRHYGYTVVAVTQSIDSVDITFRRLASQVVRITNMGFVGAKRTAKLHIYESANTDRAPLATSVFTYDLKIFKCFKSVEDNIKIEHTKFVFPKKLILVLFVLIFFVFASNKLSKGFMGDEKKEVKKTEQVAKPQMQKDLEIKEGKLCFGKDCKK